MPSIHDVPTPALLLDVDILERNLQTMAARAERLGVALRPHIKTHKCPEIGERQRSHGARGITASTLYEARVFAEHGFDDITWAFPIILNRLPEAVDLADRITLRLVVDSIEAVQALKKCAVPLHVFLKVDCGYHRAGVDPNGPVALELAHRIAEADKLIFDGILSHSGHAYHGQDRAEIARIAELERTVMVTFAERLRQEDIEVPWVSVGSTPAMTAVQRLDGVTEARPGNYALFDFTQYALGSCTLGDIAATVLTSVVSAQPHTEHSIVDAGALALSKDPGPDPPHGPTMGAIFDDYEAKTIYPDMRLVGLSQEHGKVNKTLNPGSKIRVIPNHSCLTVAQFDVMHVVRGEEIVDTWKVWRGR